MHIAIGTVGWLRSPLQNQLYPDDLPAEWRLGYYANEFDITMVPVSYWCENECEEIDRWAENLPSDFVLFFEIDVSLDAESVNKRPDSNTHSFVLVDFSSACNISQKNHYHLQEGVFIDQTDDENNVILRLAATDVINAKQIRQIIEMIIEEYCQYDVVYLLLDEALVEVNVLQTTRAIVNLICAS